MNVSTPAPAQGATRDLVQDYNAQAFQSPPPRRGRHRRYRGGNQISSFNPRPRAGGDGYVADDE